jgi:hypothetical protein
MAARSCTLNKPWPAYNLSRVSRLIITGWPCRGAGVGVLALTGACAFRLTDVNKKQINRYQILRIGSFSVKAKNYISNFRLAFLHKIGAVLARHIGKQLVQDRFHRERIYIIHIMLITGDMQFVINYFQLKQNTLVQIGLTYFNNIIMPVNGKINITLPAFVKKRVKLMLQYVK